MNARAKLDERGAGVMTWNSTQTYLRDAIKFWEPRRVGYNLVLIAVAVFWFAGLASFPPLAAPAIDSRLDRARNLSEPLLLRRVPR